MAQNNKGKVLTIAVNACRALLAATFIFSGFIKANDPFGTVYKLEDYVASMLWFSLPEAFLLCCAVLLAFFEFTLGMYLLFGMRKKTMSVIACAFMTAMTLLTVYIAIANPVEDCGCFGDVLILSNWATLEKNIVLLAAAVLIMKYNKLQADFVKSSVKWLISLLSLIFIIGYAIFCIINLPVLDFRPYKVGTDLKEAATSSSNQPKFDVKIVYEKDGKTLELGIDDDDPDSTWIYVETKRIPLKTDDIAKADFYVSNTDDEDITEDILYNDGITLLVIIPDLMHADESVIDKINDIYEHAQKEGHAFYCLTGSVDEKAQKYWTDHTGAEYEYSIAEERMLKTVVRAKPGLVILQDGVIKHKWSNFNLPTPEELNKFAAEKN